MRMLMVALLLVLAAPAGAEVDALVFGNGNAIAGEIKSLSRGVLQIETDYSDSDFKIEWKDVVRVDSETRFEIVLSDTDIRYYGQLRSPADYRVEIQTDSGRVVETTIANIVYLETIESGFWDRIFASIEIGYSLTKAQNLQQFTSRSSIGYRTKLWQLDASFDALESRQDDVEAIERRDGTLNFRYALSRAWYGVATIAGNSNTEQKLDLRVSGQAGLGKYFVRTNASGFGASLGLNRNVERYSNDTPDRNSWEGYFNTELDLYDVGDVDFKVSITLYPGITDSGRFRSSSSLDFKYDLPYDFFLSMGYSLDTDNRPAEGAGKTDYVFRSGFGWEW